MRLSFVFTLVLLFLTAGTVTAQDGRADTDKPDQDSVQESGSEEGSSEDRAWSVVPLPVFGYSPDSGLLLGARGVFAWPPAGASNDPALGDNTANVGVTYGTAGIFSVPLSVSLILRDGYVRPSASVSGKRAQGGFFGVGPDSKTEDIERFTDLEFRGEGQVLFRVAPKLSSGPRIVWLYKDIQEREADGLLASGRISGGATTHHVGIGGEVEWNTRDNANAPSSGGLGRVEVEWYPGAFEFAESHDGFALASAEYSRYQGIWLNHVIAGQLKVDAGFGDVAFFELPGRGGSSDLRGYSFDRFRDMWSFLLQGEYRFPIWWRFSGVVFAGAGQVAPTPGELRVSQLPFAAGAGVRVAVTRSGQKVRADVAYGREGVKFYVSFGEAF